MKRIIMTLAVLSLVAGVGCSKDPTGIGEGVGGLGDSKIASPTPTPSKTVKKTATPKPPPKTVAPDNSYKGRPYTIGIRSSAEGYEPRELVVYVGDTITFENHDPNQKHTFTSDKGAWDSGEVAAGGKYALKVNLAPGDYTFHCELVPYVLGGPLRVENPPKS